MIDYSRLAIPKPTPRAVDRLAAKRQRQQAERDCRAAVDARDKHVCFWPNCRRYASEKHHIVPRSVRGKTVWRTEDILSACTEHHRWFRAGLIDVEGKFAG